MAEELVRETQQIALDERALAQNDLLFQYVRRLLHTIFPNMRQVEKIVIVIRSHHPSDLIYTLTSDGEARVMPAPLENKPIPDHPEDRVGRKAGQRGFAPYGSLGTSKKGKKR